MNDISNSIKKVLLVFLICFIGLFSYITYFELFTAPQIVSSQFKYSQCNKRLWVKRNEVLRGTIYDRNQKPLTVSKKVTPETQKREYTGGPMFAHVLGYVNVKYDRTGLEKKYDDQLMTSSVQENIESFIKNKGKSEEKIGNNLTTTLDYDVQKKAYDALGDNKGAVVVMNPKTGELLAVVSKPSYDPNNLDKIWADINKDQNRPLINRATSGLYPPGSTFKTITATSALENMSGIQNRTFQDNGSIALGPNSSLSNFNGESFGPINFKNAYTQSSNVVFGTLGMELGNDKLKATAEKFFFNKDIPSDGITIENSKFPTYKSYEKGNIAQSGIGQAEVLATPMEMALVASTIANDGIMMKPMLVKQVTTSKGADVKTISPEQIAQVISKENAFVMKGFMRNVVAEGTGKNAAIEGVEVCGKTGTADHKEEGKQVAPHAWFIGFAPYKNPQVAVAVIVEEGGQGGAKAASIASEVMRTALKK